MPAITTSVDIFSMEETSKKGACVLGVPMLKGGRGRVKVGAIIRAVCSYFEKVALSEKSVLPWDKALQLPPLVSIGERALDTGLCSSECFIIAFIYAKRLASKHDGVLNLQNLLPSFLVSLIVASKFLDDFYCRSAYFSAVGGVPVKVLNDLELQLCFLLDFNLSVSKEEFDATLSMLTVESCFYASPSTWIMQATQPSLDSKALTSPQTVPQSCVRATSRSYAAVASKPSSSVSVAPRKPPICLPALHPPTSHPPLSYSDSFHPWDPAAIWQPLATLAMRSCNARDPLGAAAAWYSHVPTCPNV